VTDFEAFEASLLAEITGRAPAQIVRVFSPDRDASGRYAADALAELRVGPAVAAERRESLRARAQAARQTFNRARARIAPRRVSAAVRHARRAASSSKSKASASSDGDGSGHRHSDKQKAVPGQGAAFARWRENLVA